MKTLEDLFFGTDIPFEKSAIDRDEYRRLVEKIMETETPLRNSMTGE